MTELTVNETDDYLVVLDSSAGEDKKIKAGNLVSRSYETDLSDYDSLALLLADIGSTYSTVLISRDETVAAGTTTIPVISTMCGCMTMFLIPVR